MFLIARLLELVAFFLRLSITPVKTTADPGNPTAGVAGANGAMPDTGNIINLINNLKSNAAPAFGNWQLTRVGADVAARTYLGTEMVGGIIRRENSTTTQDSTDTATNIVNSIPGAVVGQSFPFLVANAALGTFTLGAGTGVTILGTAVVSSLATRLWMGRVTGSAAVTLTNCFQFAGGTTTFL